MWRALFATSFRQLLIVRLFDYQFDNDRVLQHASNSNTVSMIYLTRRSSSPVKWLSTCSTANRQMELYKFEVLQLHFSHAIVLHWPHRRHRYHSKGVLRSICRSSVRTMTTFDIKAFWCGCRGLVDNFIFYFRTCSRRSIRCARGRAIGSIWATPCCVSIGIPTMNNAAISQLLALICQWYIFRVYSATQSLFSARMIV